MMKMKSRPERDWQRPWSDRIADVRDERDALAEIELLLRAEVARYRAALERIAVSPAPMPARTRESEIARAALDAKP